MELPYQEPLTTKQARAACRAGACRAAANPAAIPVGSATARPRMPSGPSDYWTLHPPVGGSLPGTVWLASKAHFDSFGDMPPESLPTSVVLRAKWSARC